ncbi:hypothetical protein Gohar_027127, partial [Gossypium harknessii]|nr:hypothetical protein [Gossypium harknessii]
MKRLIENYLLEFDGIKEKLPIQRIKTERWRPPETLHVKVIQFEVESEFLRVEIEGDALSVIKKLQNDFEDRSEISAYIHNAKRLKRNFGLNEGASTYLCNGFSAAMIRATMEDYR